MKSQADYHSSLPDANIRVGQVYRSGSGLRSFKVLSVDKDVVEHLEEGVASCSSRIMWDFDIYYGRIILQEEG